MLTKAYLIDSVIELNPSVRRAWLAQFSAGEVREYLDRLRFAAEPRGASSVWVRPAPVPADAAHERDAEGEERRAA